MLKHKYSDFAIRCTMANLSGRHLNLRLNEMIIFLCVTLWKCSTRWFWHVYSSRIRMFKLSLSKIISCMQLMLDVYLFKVFIANPPCGFHVCVKIHTVVLEAGGISSTLNTLDPFGSRSWNFPNIASELRLDFDRCSQVPLSANAYNYNRQSTYIFMPLSWAYECPVKGMLGVLIEPGVNYNKWLRNSIIYNYSHTWLSHTALEKFSQKFGNYVS